MGFFKQQDAVREMRGLLVQMERGRESGRPATEDENIVL
jgi:hypothetical protein